MIITFYIIWQEHVVVIKRIKQNWNEKEKRIVYSELCFIKILPHKLARMISTCNVHLKKNFQHAPRVGFWMSYSFSSSSYHCVIQTYKNCAPHHLLSKCSLLLTCSNVCLKNSHSECWMGLSYKKKVWTNFFFWNPLENLEFISIKIVLFFFNLLIYDTAYRNLL